MKPIEFNKKLAEDCGLVNPKDLSQIQATPGMIILAAYILLDEIQALKQEIETLKKGKKNDNKKRD